MIMGMGMGMGMGMERQMQIVQCSLIRELLYCTALHCNNVL